MVLCCGEDKEFEGTEQLIIIGDQREVDRGRLVDSRVLKAFGDAVTVGVLRDFFADLGQVYWTSRRSWQTKELEKHLPDIAELPEDDLEYDAPSDDDDLLKDTESTDRIEERLTDMLSTLTTKMGDTETYLAEAIGKITSEINAWQRENIVKAVNALKLQVDCIEEQVTEILSALTAETNGSETYFAEVTSWQEKIIEAINSLKMQIANFETYGRRQKLLSYLVIGLLVLLILIVT